MAVLGSGLPVRQRELVEIIWRNEEGLWTASFFGMMHTSNDA